MAIMPRFCFIYLLPDVTNTTNQHELIVRKRILSSILYNCAGDDANKLIGGVNDWL